MTSKYLEKIFSITPPQMVHNRSWIYGRSLRSTTVIACILTIIVSCNSLVIIQPIELAGQIIQTPRVKTVGPLDWDFVIVAELVGPDAENLTDKIVLVDIPNGQAQEDMSRKYYQAGSAGVITPYRREVPYAGLGSYVWDGSDSKQLKMPSTELNLADFNLLMQFINNGTRLVVNMTSNDENPWDIVMGPGGIVLTSILTPLTAASLSFCIYKWAVWLRHKGLQWSLAQVVLIGNIIGNIIRLVSISVDPMYSRRLCPNLFNHLFATGSWPFALSTTLLISFYWQELITKNELKVSLFVEKLKVPFWVIVALIFAMEFAGSLLRGLYYPIGLMTIITGSIYVVVSLAIAIFYFIAGANVVKSVQNNNGQKTLSKSNKLAKTTERVVASGVMMILFAINVAINGLTDAMYIPWGYWSAWFVNTLVLDINSVLQAAAFNVPKRAKISSTPSATKLSLSSRSQSGSLSARVIRISQAQPAA